MPKKGEYVKFKNYEKKMKSPFIIQAEFEGILKPEENGKQNPKEAFKRKIKHTLLAVMVINQC